MRWRRPIRVSPMPVIAFRTPGRTLLAITLTHAPSRFGLLSTFSPALSSTPDSIACGACAAGRRRRQPQAPTRRVVRCRQPGERRRPQPSARWIPNCVAPASMCRARRGRIPPSRVAAGCVAGCRAHRWPQLLCSAALLKAPILARALSRVPLASPWPDPKLHPIGRHADVPLSPALPLSPAPTLQLLPEGLHVPGLQRVPKALSIGANLQRALKVVPCRPALSHAHPPSPSLRCMLFPAVSFPSHRPLHSWAALSS